MQYRREVDGLRALAVIPVILFHAGSRVFGGGFIGVDVFFVISGYLITSIIAEENSKGNFTLCGFYERRARRILPALHVMMLACVPVALFLLLPSDMSAFSDSMLSVTAFCSNVLFYLTSGYSGEPSEVVPLIHTWSLAVEEHYYLLFPLALAFVWRLGRGMVAVILAIVAIASFAAAQYFSTKAPEFDFFLLPTRAWEILAGSLVALHMGDRNGIGATYAIGESGSLLGLLLIALSIFCFDEFTPFPSVYTLVPVVGAALVILFATDTTVVGRLLGMKLPVGIGIISYSAYLWHQPIFAFERHRILANPGWITLTILSLITMTIAYLSWRFIEQPFRRKDVLTRSGILTMLSSTTAIFVLVGVAGHLTEGFPGRFGFIQRVNHQVWLDIAFERSEARRDDICHFSNATNIGIDRFLKQWNCWDDKSFPELRKIPVIVAGDSHAADKALALKSNGLMPLYISGSDCSLVPSKMSESCRRIFERLYGFVQTDTNYYKYLVISNYFTKDELTPEALRDMVAYWKKFNRTLIWFTGMPLFPRFTEYLEKDRIAEASFESADLSARADVLQLLTEAGIHVVNTKNIFCSINDCKYITRDGCLLTGDGGHLSIFGARLFGQALLRSDPIFSQWQSAASANPFFAGASRCHRPVGRNTEDRYFGDFAR